MPFFARHRALLWAAFFACVVVALERPQRNLVASAAGVVVLVVVAASLIPERAEMGAALALLAGSVAASATRWALLIGLTRARAPDVE